MMTYRINGISVALIRKSKRKEKGESPIYWRITYQRVQRYYSTGISYTKKNWNDFVERNLQKHKDTKDTLKRYLEKTLKPIINDLAESNSFSFEALNLRLSKSEITTLNKAFEDKIKRLIENNRIGNSTIYKTVMNSLNEFNGKDIPFDRVTISYLNKYEKYLSDEGVRTATISLYMRTLRAIINNEGNPYLTDEAYPFGRGRYLIKTSKGVKIALTLKQVHAIEQYDCIDTLTDLCRDLWLFSFYASGMNFTDILRIKYTDIIIGELTFVRYKTRNTRNDETFISIPILEPMKRIIQKHGNKSKGGYIFPIINDNMSETEKRKNISTITSHSNKRIKAICKELKHDDETLMIPDYNLVNNYTARHSYATILNKIGVPESFISQQLGHSNQTVTQGYFGAYDRDARFKYNSLLLNTENENKTVYLNVI